ncbi:MAG: hypothetical protein R2800_04490 [Flavipsychrobacter sp.]
MGTLSEKLLMLTVLIATTHFISKCLLILHRRQAVYFGQKLWHSFFFYREQKIRKTVEVRVKRFYIVSNRQNKLFYSLLTFALFAYLGSYAIHIIDFMQPMLHKLIAGV